MNNYVRAKLRTHKRNRIVWANKTKRGNYVFYNRIYKNGDTAYELIIGTSEDVLWEKQAHMNLKYGELETCKVKCSCDKFRNFRGDL